MRLPACLFATALVWAQSPDPALSYRVPTVRAQGSATVTAKPDQIRIDIGVVTQEQSAQAASAANAKSLESNRTLSIGMTLHAFDNG